MKRPSASTQLPVLLGLGLLLATAAPAQFLHPTYDGPYAVSSPWIPAGGQNFGGLAFDPAAPDELLLARDVGRASGGIVRVVASRHANGWIEDFPRNATFAYSTPYISAGSLCFHEASGVLFFTSYDTSATPPSCELHQIVPGGTVRSMDLAPLGISGPATGCDFVPANVPGAGLLKIVAGATATVHSFTVAQIANGTFDVTPAAPTGGVQLTGSIEGLVYVPAATAPAISYPAALVCDSAARTVTLYPLDNNGDPDPNGVPAPLTLVSGPHFWRGGCVEPQTNEIWFSQPSNRVVRLVGPFQCGEINNYGSGIAGTGGLVPTISATGCPGRGSTVSVQINNALPATPCLTAFGIFPRSTPIPGGNLLLDVSGSLFAFTDGSGNTGLNWQIPFHGGALDLNVYYQTFFIDNGVPQGFSATNGLALRLR